MENTNPKFSNLQKLSLGDKKVTDKLLDTFFATSEEIIFKLENSLNNHDNLSWRNFSHELKSMAANLGAGELYKISLESEKSFNGSAKLKRHFLGKIIRQLALLKK